MSFDLAVARQLTIDRATLLEPIPKRGRQTAKDMRAALAIAMFLHLRDED